ncbi:hypothetical protein HZB02_01355 [Candidatus Woesearchaeota archaeon]|nr:hypothetical protein [Candidatus Woesearchaeota archaeon]
MPLLDSLEKIIRQYNQAQELPVEIPEDILTMLTSRENGYTGRILTRSNPLYAEALAVVNDRLDYLRNTCKGQRNVMRKSDPPQSHNLKFQNCDRLSSSESQLHALIAWKHQFTKPQDDLRHAGNQLLSQLPETPLQMLAEIHRLVYATLFETEINQYVHRVFSMIQPTLQGVDLSDHQEIFRAYLLEELPSIFRVLPVKTGLRELLEQQVAQSHVRRPIFPDDVAQLEAYQQCKADPKGDIAPIIQRLEEFGALRTLLYHKPLDHVFAQTFLASASLYRNLTACAFDEFLHAVWQKSFDVDPSPETLDAHPKLKQLRERLSIIRKRQEATVPQFAVMLTELSLQTQYDPVFEPVEILKHEIRGATLRTLHESHRLKRGKYPLESLVYSAYDSSDVGLLRRLNNGEGTSELLAKGFLVRQQSKSDIQQQAIGKINKYIGDRLRIKYSVVDSYLRDRMNSGVKRGDFNSIGSILENLRNLTSIYALLPEMRAKGQPEFERQLLRRNNLLATVGITDQDFTNYYAKTQRQPLSSRQASVEQPFVAALDEAINKHVLPFYTAVTFRTKQRFTTKLLTYHYLKGEEPEPVPDLLGMRYIFFCNALDDGMVTTGLGKTGRFHKQIQQASNSSFPIYNIPWFEKDFTYRKKGSTVKTSGYQGLHKTIVYYGAETPLVFEVQIKTNMQDNLAEFADVNQEHTKTRNTSHRTMLKIGIERRFILQNVARAMHYVLRGL